MALECRKARKNDSWYRWSIGSLVGREAGDRMSLMRQKRAHFNPKQVEEINPGSLSVGTENVDPSTV